MMEISRSKKSPPNNSATLSFNKSPFSQYFSKWQRALNHSRFRLKSFKKICCALVPSSKKHERVLYSVGEKREEK